MNAAAAYLRATRFHLDLLNRELDGIETAARHLADSLAVGGILHVFGTGHSQLVALEAADRAAGLAAVRAIADVALSPLEGRRAAATERLTGYADVVLDTEDLRPGEVLVVVSNSGINAVPIDVALGAAERGLYVVAITSRAHSDAVAPRHVSGRRLHEIADLTLDTSAPAGDAGIALSDGTRVGPLSTVLGAVLLHAVTARAAEMLVEAGGSAPVLRSQNLDEGDDLNRPLFDRYAERTRRPR